MIVCIASITLSLDQRKQLGVQKTVAIIIRVDPRTGLCYIPKSIRGEGFTGDIELLTSALTVILIRPGMTLADISESLQLICRDILLRTQYESDVNAKIKNRGQSRKLPVERDSSPAPRWPLFVKFSRAWLSQETGYSKGYLCHVATGKIALSRSFIDRVCFRLNESEQELFSLGTGDKLDP